MSLPFYKHWYCFKVRRNRKSMILANLMILAILSVITFVLHCITYSKSECALLFGLFAAPLAITSHILASQRLKDINLSGWLALLLIPANLIDALYMTPFTATFFFFLWTIPGSQGLNRYGPNPLENPFPS